MLPNVLKELSDWTVDKRAASTGIAFHLLERMCSYYLSVELINWLEGALNAMMVCAEGPGITRHLPEVYICNPCIF